MGLDATRSLRVGVLVSALVSALAIGSSGCHNGEPPAPVGIDGAVSPLPGPGGTNAPAPLAPNRDADRPAANANGASSAAPAGSAGSAGSVVAAAPAQPDAAPSVDPGTLPQTHDKPKASGAGFDGRIALLWEAIAQDDPDRAIPAFFPVTAYEQVKAIPSPASDWRRRLVAAFKRDIHALHKRLGESSQRAHLVRADVPDDRARWVEPNEETNKLGYYRVYGTRIVYEVDGKERSFDVSSLISWRGEWYVVHLTGFK